MWCCFFHGLVTFFSELSPALAFCNWSPKLTACPQRPVPQKRFPTSPSSPFEEAREINLTASLRSGPEYSFTPHPKVECKKKTVDLPGPGEYYRADEPERSKTSFSIGPSINDLGGCPVELLHCSHCEKKTLESWTPAERGKRPRPKECSTKGCVSQDFA